jgi:methionyl-tRNA synthetase
VTSAFYITTPIYYVNDVPHVGHAYTTIVADALARYHRARGHDARMLTGTDEHGEKIQTTAQKAGKDPRSFADGIVVRFQDTWKNLLVQPDDFIRTTEPRHARVVQALWKRLEAAGDIYFGEYEGWYCVGCEAFYTEGQLEQPGNVCPQHKKPVGRVKEQSYFFRMSKYGEPLLEHIARHPDFIQPESRRNEIVSFVKGGLRDLSISRTSFDWGIPVPGDPKHVIYVWLDALTNYYSALGGEGAELTERYWPSAVHLIGKDILRFHAVYWPCFLLSAGLPLPRRVFAHGWWTVRGEKISKSLPATRVDPNLIAGDIGPDALRYFLLREIPLGADGDLSYEALIGRLNSDLANDLGNLVNRVLAIAEKNAPTVPAADRPEREEALHLAPLRANAARIAGEVAQDYEAFAPSRALERTWELVRVANNVVNSVVQAKLHRAEDAGDREVVLRALLEALYWIGALIQPALPGKALDIFERLGLERGDRPWPSRWGHELPAGGTLTRGSPLFPRIDEARQAELLARWIPEDARVAAPAPAPAPAPAGNGAIAYEDFQKLDLRVAVVTEAEKVPKADKLLRLKVDLGGGEVRQVVAGIADAYAPEAIVGRRVIFLANLAPRKIKGIESQGMILAAGEDKVLALSAIDREVPPGTKVR